MALITALIRPIDVAPETWALVLEMTARYADANARLSADAIPGSKGREYGLAWAAVARALRPIPKNDE